MSLNALSNENFPSSFYDIQGEGLPIILVHGFAENHTIWDDQVKVLSKHFKVIRPALPACGTSSLKAPLSMDFYARFLKAILDQENITKTIMMGHSMGGYASMAFLDLFPQKLIGLGLIHSIASEDSSEKRATRSKAIEHIKAHGTESFFKTLIPKLYGSHFTNKSSDFSVHYNMASKFSKLDTIACYRAMAQRPDRKELLLSLDIPLLAVLGTEDQSIDYKLAMQQVMHSNVLQLELMAGVGHTSMKEIPDRLNNILIRFCNDTYKTFNP